MTVVVPQIGDGSSATSVISVTLSHNLLLPRLDAAKPIGFILDDFRRERDCDAAGRTAEGAVDIIATAARAESGCGLLIQVEPDEGADGEFRGGIDEIEALSEIDRAVDKAVAVNIARGVRKFDLACEIPRRRACHRSDRRHR